MARSTVHRYRLRPYAGRKSRTTCPACAKPSCFTLYLDTTTGELLPDEYGRCDHEVSCGYSLSPYTRPAGGGPSYATATERGEQATAAPRPTRRAAPVAPPVVSIPAEVYRATLGHYHRNALAQLLQQHFGAGIAHELLTRFQVGTSAYWSGACVFWLIDEAGRARGGQVVLYDDTGHTVKSLRSNGDTYRHTCWAHTALARAHQHRGEAPPDWLTAYETHGQGQKSPCLFGLPQLAAAPAGQLVAVVESAKTAILATPYFPQYTWLATGGLSYLTAERLAPLRSHRIVLWPDAGALESWQRKATELGRLGFDVRVSDLLENLVTAEQRKQGFDLGDVVLTQWPGYPPSWDEKPPAAGA